MLTPALHISLPADYRGLLDLICSWYSCDKCIFIRHHVLTLDEISLSTAVWREFGETTMKTFLKPGKKKMPLSTV